MNKIENARNLLADIGVVFTQEQHDIIDHGMLVEDVIEAAKGETQTIEIPDYITTSDQFLDWLRETEDK